MGKADRAERKEYKAFLKHLTYEASSVIGDVRQAEQLGVMAVAESIKGDIDAARDSYVLAIGLLSEAQITVRHNPRAYGTLAYCIEVTLDMFKERLKSVGKESVIEDICTKVEPSYLERLSSVATLKSSPPKVMIENSISYTVDRTLLRLLNN